MLKVRVIEPGKIIYEEALIPEPNEDEALIAVKSVGICFSDIAPYKGRYLDLMPLPMVQGHEFGGIIEKLISKNTELNVGDKVAVFPHTNCGKCYYCKHKMDLLCENQRMFGSPIKEGAMTEKVVVPVSQLVKLDDDFDIRYAGLIEPATVAYRTVGEFKDSNVVIMGTGAIGMIMAQICKVNNNKVIAMDLSDVILAVAKEMGADLTVNVNDPDRKDKILKYLGDEKVDAIVIAYLNQENLDFALDVIRKNGTIAYMCMPMKLTIDFAPILFKALKIVGTISFNMEMFKKTADLVQHKLNYKGLVTKMFPMNKAKEAYEFKGDSASLKIILTN